MAISVRHSYGRVYAVGQTLVSTDIVIVHFLSTARGTIGRTWVETFLVLLINTVL